MKEVMVKSFKPFLDKKAIKPLISGATSGIVYSMLISHASHAILSSIKQENVGIFNSAAKFTTVIFLSAITSIQWFYAKNIKKDYTAFKSEQDKQNYQLLYSFGASVGFYAAYLFLFRNEISEKASTGLSGFFFGVIKFVAFDVGILACEIVLIMLDQNKKSSQQPNNDSHLAENAFRCLQVFLISAKCLFQINNLSSDPNKSKEELLQDPQFFSSLTFTLVGSAIEFKRCIEPTTESKYDSVIALCLRKLLDKTR